jgi:proteasome accessory factor C
MSDVHERLRRLLLVVPYVSRNPGVSVDDLARALGATREQLLKELDLLAMVGRPPFQPDDYIDIYVEDGRVYVDLDQRLAKPPRLTASEAVALAAAAEMLHPNPGDALHSALRKLEKVLPEPSHARYREMAQQIDADPRGPEELVALSRAISQRLEVEFEYFTPDRNATERRVVRPLELRHRGQWYLKAHDVKRAEERVFRLDRFRDLSVTQRTFAPIRTTERSIPDPVTGHGDVTVRFDDGTTDTRKISEVRVFDWKAGSGIECQWTDGGWYTATILSLAGDGYTMKVRYDDDGVEQDTNTGKCRTRA